MEQLVCCQCRNRGKCKSCVCSKSGQGCKDTCQNPQCQFKGCDRPVGTKTTRRQRVHPYASNSSRNSPGDVTTATVHVPTTSPSTPALPSAPVSRVTTTSSSETTSAPVTSTSASASAPVSTPPSTSTSAGTLSCPNDALIARMGPERQHEDDIRRILLGSLDTMSPDEKTQWLRRIMESMPHDVLRLMVRAPPPANSNTWCICGRCRPMEQERMNLCCGHEQCITATTTFHNICERADVIEIANILNWAFTFNDEPSFQPGIFRNQSYRNFVLWQWGRLGAGNRRIIPSCVVLAIRARFPSPGPSFTTVPQSEVALAS